MSVVNQSCGLSKEAKCYYELNQMCQNYAAFYPHRPSALLDCAAGVFIVREVFVLSVARWL